MAKCDTTSPLGQVDPGSGVPPMQRHLVAKYDTTAPLGQVDLWSVVSPTGRDILWPSVLLHQVRLSCVLKGKSGAISHGNSSSISVY